MQTATPRRSSSTVIRTPDQRVRVFISSTLQEVAPERAAARAAVVKLRLTPVMFELGARPHPPRALYRAYLDQSDIFVGIYWQRYGWVAPDMDISGLEDEYVLCGPKPKLIYIKAPAPEREPRLQELLKRIQADDTVSYKAFATPEELGELIENDLALLLTERFELARLASAASQAAVEVQSTPLVASPPSNLPVPRSRLIGRERELEAVRELLLHEEVGLLTVTGPAGTGKTRLALQVASDLVGEFQDGVFFVPLDAITNPELVASTIARTLDLHETGGQTLREELAGFLRGKRLLLVLDNFEQVVSAAGLVGELLESCPELKLLVTSRTSLHLRDEREFPVEPLDVPDLRTMGDAESLSKHGAVELFVQRAKEVRPDFALTQENARAVAEICARLDGLPLAIELAAARIRILTPQAMVARLVGEGGANASPLQLLTGGARDLPARQQTLRAAIEWSYDLLSADERLFFARFSVFAGGGTLEGVEEVCSGAGTAEHLDVLDMVQSLADKSLLKQEERDEEEPRFRMLAMIREYAEERLTASGEEEPVCRRHSHYFLALAEQAEPELRGSRQGEWSRRLDTEHDNLRAALGRALDGGEGEVALRLCAALWGFWFLRGYLSEGRRWLEAALALGRKSQVAGRNSADETVGFQLSTSNSAMAKVLYAAGRLAYNQGDYTAAHQLYDDSLQAFTDLRDSQGIADALNGKGLVALAQGDYSIARQLHEESLTISRELGDKRGIALSLLHLANAAEAAGDYDAKREFQQESLMTFREAGNKTGIASSLTGLGEVARHDSDYALAQRYYEESLAIFKELGHKWGTANALHNLGYVEYRQGTLDLAWSLFSDSLELYQDLGSQKGIIECLVGLGGILRVRGQVNRAVQLFSAAATLLGKLGEDLEPADQVEYERDLAASRADLDEATWEAAWARGQGMSLEEAVAFR